MLLKRYFRQLTAVMIAITLMFAGTGMVASASGNNKDYIWETARNVTSKASLTRIDVMETADRYLGTPYVFGARYGQTRTFDCSSFVKYVYAKQGIYLPRVSRDQAKRGYWVSKSNLKVGDLVFFTTSYSKGRIGHVGIYAGNGDMIHTFGKGGVKYTSIHSKWWKNHYVTARRIIK